MAHPFFWNTAVMDALASQLVAWGAGARVQKIRVVDGLRVELELHHKGVTRVLALDARRGCAVVTPQAQRRENEEAPPAFQGLLRKQLTNTRLENVTVLGPGAVAVRFVTLQAPLELVVDGGGNHPNVVLVHAERNVVLGALDAAALRGAGGRVGQAPARINRPAAPTAAVPTVDATVLAGHPLADLPMHAVVALAETPTGPRALPAVDVDVRRALKAARDKARRLVGQLEADVARAGDAGTLRMAALRAQARAETLPRGAAQWTLEDPYDAAAAPVTVPVDVTLGPRENVEKLFHRARRMDRTVEHTAPRLAAARTQLEELGALLLALDAQEPGALERARERVGATQVERAAQRSRGPQRRQPFRAYSTSTGHRVLVGRSSADNDTLTHRTARGNDLFLHARDAPGAHVILVLEGSAPPPETALREAALLAAHHSEARGHGVVDVRHTLVKHVKKVAGTPGLVTLAKERVFRVNLEDARLPALLATELPASTRT